ncbi:hypothetical protein BN903_421 [Halorubrum sp. AJ67]|nr:hypothetical protein BN903_421 [Halorubrum sp. AJ67]
MSGPDGEALGTLNETFGNDFDASVAVQETEIPDVGISASIRDVSGRSE